MSNKHNPKQVIVIRKDLDMPPGKLAAQASHASLGAILKSGNIEDGKLVIDLNNNEALNFWMTERFTKVTLLVNSEEELLKIAKLAEEKGLPTALIKDAGFTVFSEPTYTCVGIGPAFPEDFIGVTDKLKLYK